MAKKKVPEYTLRAINKYNAKFDRIAVNLERGSKEWIKQHTGKSCNQFFQELFEQYKAEHGGDSPGVGSDSGDYPKI